MKALEAIQLVVEKKAPKGWSSALGIFGKYSGWPVSVEYYVKCPKCGKVHGDFKTMREAHAKRLCDTCDLEAIKDIKKQVAQVNDPEHKVKPMAEIVKEAIDPTEFNPFSEPPERAPEGVPVPPEDEPTDTKSEIDRLLLGNWVDIALRELAEDLNVPLTDIEILDYDGDYTRENPDDTTHFTVKADHTYQVFKDEDTASEYALGLVKNDLQNEPEIFAQSWLEGFIDKEKLTDAIGDPYENWEEEEVGNLDYEELLSKLVDEGYIDFDDTVFFKKDGNARAENPGRAKKLEQLKEKYVEEKKPQPPDPFEYLEEIYGKDEAGKEALKLAPIDIDKAAKDAIQTDGWQHFISSYDGNYYDLGSGAVYVRRD
jgi:hypothetical protein